MKRASSLILAFILVLGLLAGCAGTGQQKPAGPIDIGIYHSWSTDTERGKAFAELIEMFNKENEGKIKVSVTINSDFPAYQEKVKAMISANQTPDVFHYNFNPNDLSRQQSGKLMDFSPYMDDAWKKRFTADDLSLFTFEKKLTSIPFEKTAALFFYNKKIFADAGVAEFPKTWDQLLEACEKIKQKGVAPISLFTADDAWHACNLLTYLAASSGGTSSLAGKVSLNTPEMAKAAAYLEKFFKYTTNDAIGGNYSVSMNNFGSGKTAMIVDGPWLIGMLDPTFAQDVGIASAPTFGDGVAAYGFTSTDAPTPWAAAKQSNKAKEEAIVALMKYLTSEEAVKHLTLKGQFFLSSSFKVTDSELEGISSLLKEYIAVNNAATESVVNLQRNLIPAANAKIPSIMEALALGSITPEDFAKQLDEANK